MAKYTDEQLSRILGEHAAGTLRRYGGEGWNEFLSGYTRTGNYPVCCVNQAAFNEYHNGRAKFDNGEKKLRAAEWFDRNYGAGMSPEDLLEALARA